MHQKQLDWGHPGKLRGKPEGGGVLQWMVIYGRRAHASCGRFVDREIVLLEERFYSLDNSRLYKGDREKWG